MSADLEEPQIRDIFAALAPISLAEALKYSGLAQKSDTILKNDSDRAIALSVFATMRYEYADAMMEARKKVKA